MHRRTRPALLAVLTILALAACSNETPPTPTPTPESSEGHGTVAGAAEVAEPQLHLVAVDAEGKSAMLDLLNGTETPLDTVGAAETVTTEGRYVFAADESGISIIDSGVWTWDHVDHFHYYRAEPRTIGKLSGQGVATVSTGPLSTAGTTGVFFPDSGEAVLLDNKALSEGKISKSLRLKTTPHAGLIAPLPAGALVSEEATRLNLIDLEGKKLDSVDCENPSGTITTRVGLVVGCADGAVLATTEGENTELQHIPYPSGAAAPATSFEARKGRPTVAGIGDGKGIWLLDTRESSWQWLKTTTPVVAAAAVDDADQHVVAVGEDGTVQVYDAESGKQLAVTEPLLAKTLADPALSGSVRVTVDGQRAYVNAAAGGVVHEIDYADSARVARSLELPAQPVHLVEVGR
ncbi:lipoprotein [Kineosporia sp. NBRC 101677]|uniref:hypothetical protein n=1 Tax=Kineosporia sp. NBRC 101677 TaxID=3032197 RepID=UPI0024A19B10|nr:hypothetical protein [Kineosporia sp. NBRC 101677]GLY15434.1 lipoprotein [Kineosporia sp. NBRC 101677]